MGYGVSDDIISEARGNRGNKRIQHGNIITAVLIAAVIFSTLWSSITQYLQTDFTLYDNEARILISGNREALEQNIYVKGAFPYIVFNLTGKVLYADEQFGENIGEIVNIEEMLQTDRSFHRKNEEYIKESITIHTGDEVSAFAVFLVPKSMVVKEDLSEKVTRTFLPIGIGCLTAIILMFIRMLYWNYRVLNPLMEISTSSKGIIAGNYDYEIIRAYGTKIGNDEVGDLTYSFELMRDELKEKQIREENLKNSQQELISCISHDLKTPISTIKAYSEGLRDGIAKTEASRDEYVNIIVSKTDLLIDMINDLLEFSNTQLNQLEINKKEVYFLEYFKEVMQELHGYVVQRGMKFSYDANMPNMIVTIDEKRITEVLYNLVENSMKYGKEGGRITIRATRNSDKVFIKVIDDGIGISADDIPYVFEKFYRAEKSRTSSIPGSGLGLSICKYIIEQHNGEIYCHNLKPNGCEIGFTLE